MPSFISASMTTSQSTSHLTCITTCSVVEYATQNPRSQPPRNSTSTITPPPTSTPFLPPVVSSGCFCRSLSLIISSIPICYAPCIFKNRCKINEWDRQFTSQRGESVVDLQDPIHRARQPPKGPSSTVVVFPGGRIKDQTFCACISLSSPPVHDRATVKNGIRVHKTDRDVYITGTKRMREEEEKRNSEAKRRGTSNRP